MSFKTKNILNRIGKISSGMLMITVLSLGGLEMLIPSTSQAGYKLNNYAFLSNISTAQDNTLIAYSDYLPTLQEEEMIEMKITAYSSEENQTDSTPFITASGKHVADGIVANNYLPFGTRVRIPELYGDKVFTVQDRMAKKKGLYHMDIWMNSTELALHFGAKKAHIEVLKD